MDNPAFGERFQNGAIIGQHGSWNRSDPAGYRVIFVPFADGRPSGMPQELLTGFRTADGGCARSHRPLPSTPTGPAADGVAADA